MIRRMRTAIVVLARGAARAGGGGRLVDDRGPRLRPRRRPLPVRRLRLRQARARLQADPRPLLHGTRSSARQRRRQGARPARLRQGLGRLQRRGAGLRPAAQAARDVRVRTPTAAASSCAAPAATGSPPAATEGKAGRGASDRRPRPLPGRPRRPQRGRLAAGHQRGRHRGLRQGRGRERGPVLVAARRRCAPRRWSRAPTGSRPSAAARSTTTTTPAARSTAAGRSETRATNRAVEATEQRGRQVPRRARDHLLLLDLRRADRELGVRLLRRQPRRRT